MDKEIQNFLFIFTGQQYFFIRASCMLGELLFATGMYDEARRYLTKVIETPCQDDVVDYEKNLAEDILGRL
ncbi:MAG: hypothetical protein ACTTJY_10210 [Hoylesella shahii]|uniref:hypothetical protein n=1 Tax=Hoylesella shahii TaxID=228603 RepID=UPI003FA17022